MKTRHEKMIIDISLTCRHSVKDISDIYDIVNSYDDLLVIIEVADKYNILLEELASTCVKLTRRAMSSVEVSNSLKVVISRLTASHQDGDKIVSWWEDVDREL